MNMEKINLENLNLQELSAIEYSTISGGEVDKDSVSYKIGEAVGFIVGGIVGTAERIIWTWGLPL